MGGAGGGRSCGSAKASARQQGGVVELGETNVVVLIELVDHGGEVGEVGLETLREAASEVRESVRPSRNEQR